jgi:MFS family permease
MNDSERLPTSSWLLLASSSFINFGVALQATAVGFLVYAITKSELSLGLVGLAEFIPNLVLAPVVGTVADRFDRRIVGALAVVVEAACCVALALYAGTDPTSALPIYPIVLMFGVARAFSSPAVRAIAPDLVPAALLPKLIPRTTLAWQFAGIAGPAIGGFLHGRSEPLPYWVATVVVLIGATLLLTLPKMERTPSASLRGRALVNEALLGVRLVRRTPILLGAIGLDLFAVLFGGAVALIPAIADQQLGVGTTAAGWLRASVGIGAGLMTLALARSPLTRHLGRWLLGVVMVFGVFTIVFGVTSNYVVAFVALAVLSAADSVSVFIRLTLVPIVTPDAMRGRVLAVENVFIGASNELGAFESGVAGSVLGASGSVVFGGVAVIAIVVVWWFKFPVLRDVDRFEDARQLGAAL